jgi:hypothetical protein
MRKPLIATFAFAVTLAVAFTLVGGVAVTRAAQAPNINNAYRKLSRAQYVLEHACRTLGGHRAAALKDVQAAINELHLAAQAAHTSLPAVAESGSIKALPGQIHPYVHDALRQCREAKSELASAKHHFGGHRVKAINHIDSAIVQLQEAVKEPRCKKA